MDEGSTTTPKGTLFMLTKPGRYFELNEFEGLYVALRDCNMASLVCQYSGETFGGWLVANGYAARQPYQDISYSRDHSVTPKLDTVEIEEV